MSHTRPLIALATAAAVLVPAGAAVAADYPPPTDPGKIVNPRGKPRTLRVCKSRTEIRRKRCFASIQKAVNAARPYDIVRVAPGVYNESIEITGKNKRGIQLVGSPSSPRRTVLELKSLTSFDRQNGVQINGANGVSVSGFAAYHYTGNGFFAVNVKVDPRARFSYKLNDLVAGYGGTYGVYGFNSVGGEMRRDEAFYNNDSGFYIGQTPPQPGKKVRSIAANLKAWGNVLGWSGTNMKYVTITDSSFYNNGLGIVPSALTSEKYYPPEGNVIVNNRVFWNNFNYFKGAPFKLRPGATGDIAYPVGTGILLFGSKTSTVQGNKAYGNFLMGIGSVEQIIMANAKASDFPKPGELAAVKEAAELRDNTVRDNVLGNGGRNPNGRDLYSDGNGSGNCWSNNTAPGVAGGVVTFPTDGSTFSPCPHTGPNAFSATAQLGALQWTAASPNYATVWVKRPQQPIPGINPLVICVKAGQGCKGQPR